MAITIVRTNEKAIFGVPDGKGAFYRGEDELIGDEAIVTFWIGVRAADQDDLDTVFRVFDDLKTMKRIDSYTILTHKKLQYVVTVHATLRHKIIAQIHKEESARPGSSTYINNSVIKLLQKWT